MGVKLGYYLSTNDIVPPFYLGGGISKSLQIFLTKTLTISLCLGMADVLRFDKL